MSMPGPTALSDPSRRSVEHVLRLLAFALALVGALASIISLWQHLTSDPLIDFRAYYDGASRLNHGEPLYRPQADADAAGFYRYPPFLAILLRPLALLPYETAAAIWALVIVGALALTLARLGVRRPRTWLVLGILGLPIAWSVAIGQAQVLVTFLLALGSPWAVALAGQLKIFPALAALYWVGRRDWGAFSRFLLVSAILVAVQFILAPADTIALLSFPTLEQVGNVRNISPFVVSPALWLGLVIAGALGTIAVARTRWGWAAAVAFSVLVSPRVLVYMLGSLWAGVRRAGEDSVAR